MTPKRCLWATLLLFAVLIPGLCGGRAMADTQPYFQIINKYSGLAIDLIGGNTANGAVTNLWTPDVNSGNQRWALEPTADGQHFKIVSWVTGKALSVANDSGALGNQIWQWDYNNDLYQMWDLVDAGNGWFRIRNVATGLVLDDYGYGTGNDTELDEWSDNTTTGNNPDNQTWRIQPWGTYYIQADGGRYICCQGGGVAGAQDGAPIIQYDYQTNPWFQWNFTNEGDGWYALFSVNSPGRVISVDNDSTANAANTQLWDYNASDTSGSQQVRIEPKTDGKYKFYFKSDGMSWDMPGGATGDNVPLQQYPDNANSWQEFSLQRVDSSSGPQNDIYSVAASSIPTASLGDTLSLRILNGTGGAFTDSQIYWAVLGLNSSNQWCYLDLSGNLQPISAALNNAAGHLTKNGVNYANIYHTLNQQPWTSLPHLSSGRLYISVGSPCYITTYDNGFAGPDINNPSDPNLNVYFDFTEFSIDNAGYHGNTTRVDMFGLPLQHRVVNSDDSYDRTTGELESQTRSGIFSEYVSAVPSQFQSLGTVQAPYRIIAPIHGSFAAGGANANYFAGYSSISTQDILLGVGGAADAPTCAAINRHVYTESNWNNVADYYKAAPANYYAWFWHTIAIDGLAYGFCYDDVNQQSSYLETGNPKGLIIRVGW